MNSTTLPDGWFLAGSHPADYDAGVTPKSFEGKAAMHLRARVASTGFGTIMQQFKADAYPTAAPPGRRRPLGERRRLGGIVDARPWDRTTFDSFDNMQSRANKVISIVSHVRLGGCDAGIVRLVPASI
jgi:hypothetical protein